MIELRERRGTSSTDSVGLYLGQIGQVPLLDAAEESELAQRIEAGRAARARMDGGETGAELRRAVRSGERAKDQFVRANLRLVVSIARRYPVPRGMELLDLIQEGNLGLEHAVELFDWRRGFKFSTYATYWIRQGIGRALDQKGSLIRLPTRRAQQLRGALQARRVAGEELDAEMSEMLRLTRPTSLDRPLGDDGLEFGDLIGDAGPGPESTVVNQLNQDAVLGLLDGLDPRPRRAVELRVGLVDGQVRSFREVGAELGVTGEAARRLVKRALEHLRDRALDLDLAA